MLPALVLDTNTVLALWMFRDPGLHALRAFIAASACTLHSRDDALQELRCVLGHARFGLANAARTALFDAYRALVVLAPSPAADAPALPQCRDGDDQKFVEIARDAGAGFLLTRDKEVLRLGRHRLLRQRFIILTPERFVGEFMSSARP